MKPGDAMRAIGADESDVHAAHHAPGGCWACGACLMNGTIHWCTTCGGDACQHQSATGHPRSVKPAESWEADMPDEPDWDAMERSDADPGL